MAIIKFGLVVTDARGKLGGHVFTKTLGGPTLRTLSVPANPQTPAQMAQRTSFGEMSQQWNDLTLAQQTSWINGAKEVNRTNSVGNGYKMSGKNLFISANVNRALLGLPFIPSYVSASKPGSVILNSAAVDVTDGAILLDQTLAGPASSMGVIYMASKPASGGKASFSGQMYVFHVTEAAAVVTPEQLYTAYVAKFGDIQEGQRIGFSSHVVVKASGLASPKSSAVATVTA